MRRPLAADIRDENQYVPPMERIMKYFAGAAAMPPYCQRCAEPFLRLPDIADVARSLGFPAVPQGKTGCYPPGPLADAHGARQHPTAFLQWGWAVEGKRQILFEIGDASFLTTALFLKETPGDKDCPWQLDMLSIDTGAAEIYHLPCDEPAYRPHADGIMNAVSRAVRLLNADHWGAATDALNPVLRGVVRELDDISDRMAREHAARQNGHAPHMRQQAPKTP